MKIEVRALYIMNLLYCYVPCLVFLFGWCRFLVSIPSSIILVVLAVLFIKRTTAFDSIRVSKPVLITTAVISASLCLIIGFGGIFANYYDYNKHSAVIQDLVSYDWPVTYSEYEPAMLTYYLGQYLLPALFGKILHSRIAAELLMGAFGWIGVYLLFINLVVITKADNGKKQLWLLVMFFFFSGMLLPLQIVAKLVFGSNSGDILDPHWFRVFGWTLQYRSTLTAIKWTYPQYIVPCIGAAMLLRKDSFKDCALFMLPSMIFGTWGFLCLVMITVFQYVIICVVNRKVDFGIVSGHNIAVALIGCVFLFYYMGNLVGDKPDYARISIMTNPKYYVFAYLPFIMFMFGFYVLLLYKDFKNDKVFLSVVSTLLVIPCFRMGFFNDFVMCTSMPALFLLFAYVFRFLSIEHIRQKLMRKTILSMCLLLACGSPLIELKQCFPLGIGFPKRTLATYTDRKAKVDDDCMKYNYFTYYPENTFFYKYLSKK